MTILHPGMSWEERRLLKASSKDALVMQRGVSGAIRRAAFKAYWRLHYRFHRRIMSRLTMPLFGGLHPSNVWNMRDDFFVEQVDDGACVIDVACGTGALLKTLAPKICRGVGLDRCRENLTLGEQFHSAKNLEYVEGDVLEFDYAKLKERVPYTVALFSHILEHVEDPASLLRRVGAEVVLVCVPSEENWETQLAKHFGLPYLTCRTHFREYTRDDLSAHLRQGGYSVSLMGFNAEGHIVCRGERENQL